MSTVIFKRLVLACSFIVVTVFNVAEVMSASGDVNNEMQDKAAPPPPPPPILVRATGYAVYSGKQGDQADPKRLHAIRAAKLDAYRNLAERVYGIALRSQSSVAGFELKHDSLATSIDTMIRGARVVSISENKTTGIEAVLEILLPGQFKECLNNINHFRYGADCLQPLTPISLQNEPIDATDRRGGMQGGMQTIYYLN